MSQSKLIKYTFNLADIVCWVFIIIAIGNLISVFIPPEMTLWAFTGLSKTTNIILEFINTAIGGIGFYLFIKRKIIGFVLVIITITITLIAQKVFFLESLYIPLSIFIILGLPLILSYKEISNENET